MTQTSTTPPVLFPAEIHVKKLDIATGVRLDAFDDMTRKEGTIALNEVQAQMLMRDLAAALGFTVTRNATLTAPFTADQLRSADLNAVTLLFRDGTPMTFAASLAFGLGSFEGDFEGFAQHLTGLDRERAGEVG